LRETIEKKNLDQQAVEAINSDLHGVIEELRLVTSGFKIDENDVVAGNEATPKEPEADTIAV
jgi:hypothetical protein